MRQVQVIGIIAIAGIAAAQEPTIRVPVRLVTLNTLVISLDNRLLSDLRAADFRITDNGHPQRFTLEPNAAPLSIAVVVQVSQDVKRYVPWIANVGSVLDTLVLGETGEAAVIAYSDEISVVKTFDAGDLRSAFRGFKTGGATARMLDAGSRGIALLTARPRSRARVLLLIGQPLDTGSESDLASLTQSAEKEDISVYALTLPLLGKTFVSDTFSLNGVSGAERGGFRAGVDLGKLISTMSRTASEGAGVDPFSALTRATGGLQLHFRTQHQLEAAMNALGTQLRSGYLLTYYPDPADTGYHTVNIEVSVPGAKVYSRPGYFLSKE